MRKEKGAIVVEATIALTTFIFVIITILSIVNICFIQSKMAVALNTAAKEISQYSYLYYAVGLNRADAAASAGTGESKVLAKNTIDGVGQFMTAISDGKKAVSTGEFNNLVSSVESGVQSVDSLVTQYGDAIGDDPKGFIIGMGKMALSESKEVLKSQVLAKVIAKGFMKKNLRDTPGADPDAFLRRYNVVDGLDGLNFQYSTLMAYGTSPDIQLVVTYDVEVLKLLDIDVNFTIRQCSKTRAWGNGYSKLDPASNVPPAQLQKDGKNVWDMTDTMKRGEMIVENEKKDYKYTDSGHHFDAYDNTGGKNEFVTVTSIDTHMDSYKNSSAIKSRLNSVYNDMYSSVSGMGEEVTVTDSSGTTTTVHSDTETRSYGVVLVLPDDADRTQVGKAVREFKEAHPGVRVTIRTGYGSSGAKTPAAAA